MMESKSNVRRVGTFTMGIYLIVVGLVVLLANFFNNIDFMFILKLTPVIFIMLGIEVVIYNLVLKTEKIKYDIFSIFICFVLICFTICTAVFPFIVSYFGPEREEKINTYEKQVENLCYNSLKDDKKIIALNVNANCNYFYGTKFDENMHTYLSVRFSPDILNEDSFVTKCYEVLSKLNLLDISFENINLYVKNDNKSMRLSLDNKFSQNLDKNELYYFLETDKL